MTFGAWMAVRDHSMTLGDESLNLVLIR